MSGALSKRQQARNEKILQELVQTVPGNNQCADCHARNPAWASWSLGVFLCMRCAAIHRKLGTHISKIKSLSMDSWSNEQVDNMRKVGNATSNKIYNPQSKKPPVPVDADEVDSAMERFIRQKYMNNSVSSTKRHNTGSTESDETPPPLPPKTPSRFGFRSASSIFPLSSKAKKDVASSRRPPSSPRNPQELAGPDSPRNKASKVFGASVQYDGQDETERKLAKIRDMGFLDDQRNAMVLRGMNGNMEKTVEALVRLGEGDGRAAPRDTTTPLKRSLTPTSTLSVPQTRGTTSPLPSPNNPFDMLDMPAAQPQSSQSTGSRNPYHATNPFGISYQQNLALDQALQNMSLSPVQPLFPHHTGGVPMGPQGQVESPTQAQMREQMQTQMQQPSHVTYQPQMASPADSQNLASMSLSSSQTYPAPMQQPMPTSRNPFFSNVAQQPTSSQPLSVNTTGILGQYANNPFLSRSPTRVQSPSFLAQIPEQSQQDFYSSPVAVQQSWVSSPISTLPYGSPASAVQPQNNPFFTAPQPVQQYQAPPRPDTASIMALYNYPQSAPNPFQQPQSQPDQSSSVATGSVDSALVQQQQQQMLQQQPQHAQNFLVQPPTRAMTSPPTSGSRNPFVGLGGGGGAVETSKDAIPGGARSRDSVLAQGMEWNIPNGRHSPDAFASLSARDMR